MAGVIGLLNRYQQMKYRPNQESFADYCNSFDRIVRELALA